MRFFFLRFFFSGFFSLSRSLFSHPTFFSLFSPLQKKKTFKKKKFRYIPKYTWKGLVRPMWSVIRAFTRAADLTLVPSATMKATLSGELERFFFFSSCSKTRKTEKSHFFSLSFQKQKNEKQARGAGSRSTCGARRWTPSSSTRGKEREREKEERERKRRRRGMMKENSKLTHSPLSFKKKKKKNS